MFLRDAKTECILLAASTLLILSIIAILVNFFYYQYPGNNYFPSQTPLIALSLGLMYLGASVQFGRDNKIATILKEVIYFFLVMSLLAITTNAAQWTPFLPIDEFILTFENYMGINMAAIVGWTDSFPLLKQILTYIYDSLPYQMSYIPLLVIITQRFQLLREYYFLLIFSALIGFTFYYFFPTTAPASIINSPYFNESQRATGLKFSQIHHYIQPSTLEGGMIALPSFHAIWAWFCLYLVRDWHWVFLLLLPFNLLLIASCILLGWHYPLDIVGSVVVVLMTHGAYSSCKKRGLN